MSIGFSLLAQAILQAHLLVTRMIPASEHAQFMVITLMTWLISASGSTHIVAGSVEAYLLVLSGDRVW